MDLEAVNRSVFLLVNAPADLAGLPLALAIGAANYGDMVLIALVIWRVVLGAPRERRALVWVAAATALAMGVNHLIGLWFPHPRPFAIGLGHTFISHRQSASFPSAHATFMWTVALGLVALWPRRVSSWIAVLLALMTSWARVFVGLHFPLDILGSVVVAAGSLLACLPIRRICRREPGERYPLPVANNKPEPLSLWPRRRQ